MSKAFSNRIALEMALVAALVCACGAGQKTKEPALELPKSNAVGKEPKFKAKGFYVLQKATAKETLPFLADGSGNRMDLLCFEDAERLEPWDTAHRPTLENMSKNNEAMKKAILAWLELAIAPAVLPSADAKDWKIEIETPAILHAPLSKIRFTQGMKCIGEKTGKLPQGSRAVTTLFGARVFHFKSPKPVDNETLVAMRKAIRKAGMKIEEAESYVLARDDNGKTKVNPEGKKLYTSPDGKLILKKQIPRPKDRVAYEWTLLSKTPIYFAWGELPSEALKREFNKEKCALNLVFNDATPRVPECPFQEAGFGVLPWPEPSEAVVRVTADHITRSEIVAFDKVQMIQVGGRVVVWVKAEKIEEGALLKVDSLVLDPGAGPPDALKSFAPQNPKPKGR